MKIARWLCPCCSDDGERKQPEPPIELPAYLRRALPAHMRNMEANMEEPQPPPYSTFDPHPEDCFCAVHVHKPRPIRPIVVEAFQSQGCNSCPPTNMLLLSVLTQADPNILVLDYHVTYWDHLGWKDPFGSRGADRHQREYAQASGTSRVYTPQVIINGIASGTGDTTGKLETLIRDGAQQASQRRPWLMFSRASSEDGILITEASAAAAYAPRHARVIEVLYDPTLREVRIQRGENARRTLAHRNIVKSVKDLGTWVNGQGPVSLPDREGADGLERVLLVQEGIGGEIIGAARIPF